MPPRLMPAPSEKQPVRLQGGMNCRRRADRGVRVDVGAALDQQRDDVRIAFAYGHHERGLLELRIARIERGAVIEQ